MQIINISAHFDYAGGRNNIWSTAEKKNYVVDFSLGKGFVKSEFAQNIVLLL